MPHQLIESCTPESKEVTQALAKGAARLFNSKVTVAVTGLTTAGGSETPEKPVGTMFISIISPKGSYEHREMFEGSAEQIVLSTIDKAAQLVTELINKI